MKLFAKWRLMVADSRSSAEAEVTGKSKPILKHLMVILRYDDLRNYHKHIDDLNSWLYELQFIKLKSNKVLKYKDYYQWLYLDQDVENLSILNKRFILLDKIYKLPVLRTSEQIHKILSYLYDTLSTELSSNNFQGIEDLIKKSESKANLF
jgi:hypothetical protein